MQASAMQNNLRRYRNAAGLNLDEAGEAIGMSGAQVSRLERGKSDLSTTRIEEFAELYGCEPWEITSEVEYADGYTSVNVLVVGNVQAGEWLESVEWEADEQYFKKFDVRAARQNMKTFALRVRGPSMNKILPDGSHIHCVKMWDWFKPAEDGDLVVVQRSNGNGLTEATVKRLRINPDGSQWLWPESEHPEHQAPLSLDGEDIELWAVVIGYNVNFLDD